MADLIRLVGESGSIHRVKAIAVESTNSSSEKDVNTVARLHRLKAFVQTSIVEKSNKFTQLEEKKKSLHVRKREVATQLEKSEEVQSRLDQDSESLSARRIELQNSSRHLNTSDLHLTGARMAKVERLISDNPSFIEEHVNLETATDLGFERHDLPALMRLAGELGHPVFLDENPDLTLLSRSEVRYFLVTLGVLQDVFDQAEDMPLPKFNDLPRYDKKALHTFLLDTLRQKHPDLHKESHYKYRDLANVAVDTINRANAMRITMGTDLFEPSILRLMTEQGGTYSRIKEKPAS